MRRSIVLSLLSIVCLLPNNGSSAEAEHRVVIRAVNAADGAAVKADIKVRSLEIDERPLATTDSSGKYEAFPFECGLGMAFHAIPVGLVYSRTNDWKPCLYGEIVFEFSRTAYAPIIERTQKIDFEQFRGSSPEVYVLGQEFLAANETGMIDRIPVIATELSARLRQLGRADLSNDISVVAFEAANVTLGVESELAFDSTKKRFLFTNESVSALRSFQERLSLTPSGALDWNTSNAMASDYVLQQELLRQLELMPRT